MKSKSANAVLTLQRIINGYIREDLNNNILFRDNHKIRECLDKGKRIHGLIIMSLTALSAFNSEILKHAVLFIEYLHCALRHCQDRNLSQLMTAAAMIHLSNTGIGVDHQTILISEIYSYSEEANLKLLSPREQEQYIRGAMTTTYGSAFVLSWLIMGKSPELIYNIRDIGSDFGFCYHISTASVSGSSNSICHYRTRNELIDLYSAVNRRMIYGCQSYGIWTSEMLKLNRYLTLTFRSSLA